MRVRALVVSDTHIGPAGRELPREVLRIAEQSDVILHGGDILVARVLDLFNECAPTYAVLGNNDHDLVGELPERREIDVAGVKVALVHDSGAATGANRVCWSRRTVNDGRSVVPSRRAPNRVGSTIEGPQCFGRAAPRPSTYR